MYVHRCRFMMQANQLGPCKKKKQSKLKRKGKCTSTTVQLKVNQMKLRRIDAFCLALRVCLKITIAPIHQPSNQQSIMASDRVVCWILSKFTNQVPPTETPNGLRVESHGMGGKMSANGLTWHYATFIKQVANKVN